MNRSGLLSALLFAALVPATATAAPVLWDPGSGGNGHYYELVYFQKSDTSWTDARDAAAAATFAGSPGHLVSITSEAEDDFVRTAFAPQMAIQIYGGGQDAPGDFVWIGLSDFQTEGVYEWITSEPTTFSNWGPFEPGGEAEPGADFVHVRVLDDRRGSAGAAWEWNDLRQDISQRTDIARIGYIVEFDDVPSQCELDLASCDSERAQALSDLSTVQSLLTTCDGNLGAAQATLSLTEAGLAQCEVDKSDFANQLTVATSDSDGDGVRDLDDECPQTPASTQVDKGGCSLGQFCGRVDVHDAVGRRTCRKADWRNDEPLMTGRSQNCTVAANLSGGGDDRCVPRQ